MGWVQDLLHNATTEGEEGLTWVLTPTFETPLLDVKLWIGIIMWGAIWAYWLRHIGEESAIRHLAVSKYWTTAVMVLGLDLAALSFLQQLKTLGFLGVFTMVMINTHCTRILFHAKDLEKPPAGEEKTIPAESLYEDVLSSFMQLIIVYITQTCLFLYLFYASFVQYTNDGDVCYGFWVTAYLVQMSGMFKRGKDSQLGATWHIERFRGMTHINQSVEYKKDGKWVSISQWQMYCRRFMGFTVNTVYRDLIAFLTPIVLMQSDDAMDFVQNCFAVSYITQLDDISDAKELVCRLREGSQLEQPLLA